MESHRHHIVRSCRIVVDATAISPLQDSVDNCSVVNATVRHLSQADHEPARVVDRYWSKVLRVCRAHSRSEHDAEDAAQETFLQFLEADRTRIVDVESWLAAVACNICSKIHRRRYRAAEILDRMKAEVATPDPGDLAVDAAWFDALSHRLKPSDHRVLRLLYVERLTLDQVAEQLGVTNGNARVIAYRARRHAVAAVDAPDARAT